MKEFLKKIGTAIAPAFKHMKNSLPVLWVILLVLAIIATWWLLPKWEYNGGYPLAPVIVRTSITLSILLLMSMMLWVIARSRQRKAEALIKRQKAEEDDPILPFLDAQQRSFDEFINLLRENVDRKNYLYKLPWFMILGTENAGKTSLINRSNQSYSLTVVAKESSASKNVRREHQLFKPKYSVDWWVSNEAVLIDPDGELLSQGVEAEQDYAEQPFTEEPEESGSIDLQALKQRQWNKFVRWLGATRSRRPLNGAILAVDISSLMGQGTTERNKYAGVLRARLRELMEQLGTRLPVYVVLTKLDLVNGFNVFFENLPASKRDTPLGFTFSLDTVDNADKWLDELDTYYSQFISNMNEQIFDLMPRIAEQSERDALFSFVRQIAGVKTVLRAFLADVLESDRYSTAALVRGVYFSSVYQHGLPVNQFLRTASLTYSVPEPVLPVAEMARSVMYFTSQLFSGVVYPESGLAGDNLKVVRRKRKVMMFGSVVSAVACMVMIFGWQYYYQQNKESSQVVLNESKAYIESGINDEIDDYGYNLLEPLSHISKAVTVFGPYRERLPLVADLGLYQGRTIGPKVDATYLDLLSTRYLPALAIGAIDVINNIDDKLSVGGLSDRESERLQGKKLEALRVYRMILDRGNRRSEIVNDWMARRWQSKFPQDGATQKKLMEHLRYAMMHTDTSLPQFETVLFNAQQDLLRLPIAQRVYRTLKQNAQTELSAPLDIRNQIGPAFDIIFMREDELDGSEDSWSKFKIDRLLTQPSFDGYFVKQNKQVTDLALVDAWVLGLRDKLDYSDGDESQLQSELRNLYVSDYINTWRQTINQLVVRDFEDISHSVHVLETVTGPTTPLKRFLEVIRHNGLIYAQASAENANEVLHEDPDRREAQRIARAFAPLRALLTETEEGKPPYFEEVNLALDSIYDYMRTIKDSPDRGKAALDATKQRFALKGADPIYTLTRIAHGLPSPLDSQVTKIADQSWKVILVKALQELENRWDREIYSFYQTKLATRYPFNPKGEDASLEDFELFFSPQGLLSKFYEKYLKLFFEENINALTVGNEGATLVQAGVLQQLQAAWDIQRAFFNKDGSLQVPFSLEPLALSGTHRRSVLNVDGQIVPYNHGPSYAISLIWPNTLDRSPESKLVLTDRSGQSKTKSYRGPWSWFRLLELSELNGTSLNSIDISFGLGRGKMRYRLRAQESNNPLTARPLEGFTIPRTLLNSSGMIKSTNTR